MKRPYPIIAAAALGFILGLVSSIGPATAEPLDIDDRVPAPASIAGQPAAPWILIEARNHLTGARSLAAVRFGLAHERGRVRMASLQVDCFEGRMTVRIDADGLDPGPWAVPVRTSLDGGRFVAGTWQAGRDGNGLVLSGDRAVAFVSDLFGKGELRLAVVRPLSVPFLLRFVVDGAEAALRPLVERCGVAAGPAISDAGR